MTRERIFGRFLSLIGLGTWLAVIATAAATLVAACGGERPHSGDTTRISQAVNSNSCSFTVTQNVYDGPQWWGTISFKNNGPASSSNYKVEFDVPFDVHCTADAVPTGSTLSPLASSGSPRPTVSNHCVFTWTNTSALASGATKTFNYSADSQAFSEATNVVVTDPVCGGGPTGTGAPGGSIVSTDTDVGTLPGDLTVDPSGHATYTIPLWTPEGRNGMTPELALTYSSARGDSSVGYGWALQGGSSMIYRCAITPERAKSPDAVKFDSSDVLCLDGNPLTVVNSANNGTVGAEYRTHNESYTKVVIDAVDTNGPTRFSVYTPDGHKEVYGTLTQQPDPSFVVGGKRKTWTVSDPLSRDDQVIVGTFAGVQYGWLRASSEDQFQNKILYTYTHPPDKNSNDGRQEPLINTIDYVDVSGFRTRSIRFAYEDRDDVAKRAGYISGMQFTITQRLKSIDMQVARPGTQTLQSVRYYELTPALSATTRRILLKSIKEWDANPLSNTGRAPASKQPTTFTYEGGFAGFRPVENPVKNLRQSGDTDYWGIQSADVNHDGRDDLLYRARPEGAAPTEAPHWYARLSQGETFADPVDLNLTDAQVLQTGDAIVGDFFGGDGLVDLIVPAGGLGQNLFAFYQNQIDASGQQQFVLVDKETDGVNRGIAVGDFNGHGGVSILRTGADGRWSYSTVNDAVDGLSFISNPSDSLAITWPADHAAAGWSLAMADVDGDGATNLLIPAVGAANRLGILRHNIIPVETPSASDWSISPTSSTLLSSTAGDPLVHMLVDQNGDGLPDVVRLRKGNNVPDLIVNFGSGFARPRSLTGLLQQDQGHSNVELGAGTNVRDLVDPGVRVVDLDGDGRQDLLLVDDGTARDSSASSTPKRSTLKLLRSQGDDFVAQDLGIAVGLPADGPIKPDAPGVHNYKQSQVMDVNGDGRPDIVQVVAISSTEARVYAYVQDGGVPDVLTDIKDGMGKKTKVIWRPMTAPDVYSRRIHCNILNQKCPTEVGWLVGSYKVDNGVGNNQNEYKFHYNDQRLDKKSGSTLGFISWTRTDVTASTTVTEEFDLDPLKVESVKAADDDTSFVTVYPQIGLPTTRTTTTNVAPGFVRKQVVTYSYDFAKLNDQHTYLTRPRFLKTVETETRDTPAGPVTTDLLDAATTYGINHSFDDFGAPPSIFTTSITPQGTYHEETTWTYQDFPGLWPQVLTTSQKVISNTPVQTHPGRVTNFTPDIAHNGVIKDITVEPSDTVGDLYLKTEYTRNSFGEVTTIKRTDRAGKVRLDTIDYDAQSVHPAKLTNALGHATSVNIDPGLGLTLSTTDPNNVRTTFDYDGFGRVRRVNLPGGGGESRTYARRTEDGSAMDDRALLAVTIQLDGGGQSVELINRLGQTTREERRNFDGSTSFITNSYNELGLPSATTRPAIVGTTAGASTTWFYDALGRMTKRVRPEDGYDANGVQVTTATATQSYDGLSATVTDDFGRTTQQTLDSFGRILKTQVLNDLNQLVPTELTYGSFGTLKAVARIAGNGSGFRASTLDYDTLGRQTQLVDPDAGTQKTKYNAFGEVREETDGAGSVISYVRDALGRVTERNDKDGKTTYTWDTNGKGLLAATMSSTGVGRQFLHDGAGRVYREIWSMIGQTFQVDYSFDGAGRLQKTSYPSVPGFSRFVVKNTYDPESGQLSKVQNDSSGLAYWALKSTKPDGQVDEELFGNKVITDYDHSAQTGRLLGIKTVLPGTSPVTLRNWTYDYWKDGNVRRRSDVKAGQHERFKYDGMGRLKQWMAASSDGTALPGGWTVNYTLDDFGGMTGRQFVAGSATGGTSQNVTFTIQSTTSRVVSSSLMSGSYGYDGNGNQTSRPGSETITYTAFDLPKTITGPRASTFLYEAFGARAKKRDTDTGDYTLYVARLYEKRVSGSTIDHVLYVPGGNGVAAQVVRREGVSGETISYLHADNLGSIDSVSNSTGGVVTTETVKRDPYGNRVTNFNQPVLSSSIPSSSKTVHSGFTGHEQDDDLGLVNMRGRIFDARLGRFLTPDPLVQFPLNGQSHNRYAYVLNNPTNLTDPTGFGSCAPSCYVYGSGVNKRNFRPLNVRASPPAWSIVHVTRRSDTGAVNPALAAAGQQTNNGATTGLGAAVKAQAIPGAISMPHEVLVERGIVAGGYIDGVVNPDGTVTCEETRCTAWGLYDDGTYVAIGFSQNVATNACVIDCATDRIEASPVQADDLFFAAKGLGKAGLRLGRAGAQGASDYIKKKLAARALREGAQRLGGSGGRHILLGLERYGLSELAEKIGAETLMKDPNWRMTLLNEIANASTQITVSLEGFEGASVVEKVMKAAQQGLMRGATPTNWEMAQLWQAGRLATVRFVNRLGEELANPFK